MLVFHFAEISIRWRENQYNTIQSTHHYTLHFVFLNPCFLKNEQINQATLLMAQKQMHILQYCIVLFYTVAKWYKEPILP